MAQVREAIRILEKALPNMQIGSKEHDSTVKALQVLTKDFPASNEMPGIQNSTLMGLQRSARESAMMQQLTSQMTQGAGGGGAPGAGGQPPQMPPGAPAGM